MQVEARSERAAVFERLRPRLFGVAYRMLGSAQDAEDVLQTAYVRWHPQGEAAVRDPEAWLVATVTRLSIDRLRSASAERARYVGDWLPEPIPTPGADARAELATDLSMAFLVLLERLSPDERAALLLRDVFGADYAEIASTLEKSEPACRQLLHRARERVRDGRVRFPVASTVKRRLAERFLSGLQAGDERALLELVAEDAEWTSDGGGKVHVAHGVRGARRIVTFQLRLARKLRGRVRYELVSVNEEPAIATYSRDGLFSILSLESDGERLVAFYAVVNPDKLRHLAALRSSSPSPSRVDTSRP